MKILKYEFTGKDKYHIFFDNGEVITISEKVITENEILLKKDIDKDLYNKLIEENKLEEIYQKAIKYINIRLRSIKEVKDYLNKKEDNDKVEIVIDKLIKNKYLDDKIFAKAFITDKLNFTLMGDYKIKMELQRLGVSSEIIEEMLSNIDKELLDSKMIKIIEKDLKTNKKYSGLALKNKIYNHLVSQGYQKEKVLSILSNYNF